MAPLIAPRDALPTVWEPPNIGGCPMGWSWCLCSNIRSPPDAEPSDLTSTLHQVRDGKKQKFLSKLDRKKNFFRSWKERKKENFIKSICISLLCNFIYFSKLCFIYYLLFFLSNFESWKEKNEQIIYET